jgi:hypothetical protein
MNAKRLSQILTSTLGGLLFMFLLILWLSLLPSGAYAESLSSLVTVVPINSGEPQITSNPPFTIYLPVVFKNFAGCSTIPSLFSPTNGSNLQTLIPLFQWDSGNNLQADAFHLDLSRNSGFTDIIDNLTFFQGHGAGNFRFSDNLDPGSINYWRTYLTCGGAKGPYSEVWSFTTGSGGIILPAPTLVSPTNGGVVPTTTVTLQWSPMSGATGYQVNWRKVGQGGYSTQSVTGTPNTIVWLSTSTTYEWWVSARNDYAFGVDSEKWRFTTPAGSSSVSIQDLNNTYVVDDGSAIIVFER